MNGIVELLFEISNQIELNLIEKLSSASKVTSSKYFLNKFNRFMAPHCCGFCCRSFSTWWTIMGQQTTPCLLILLVARVVAKVKNRRHSVK